MKICQAITRGQIELSRALFEEYAGWLGIDLSFQGFAAELAGLPGVYAPPPGRLLLALRGSEAAGCVAPRPLGGGVCEIHGVAVVSLLLIRERPGLVKVQPRSKLAEYQNAGLGKAGAVQVRTTIRDH